MPSFRHTETLAANETNSNVMQGSQFEFPGRPTRVQVYAIAEAGDAVDIEVFFGQELQLARSPLTVSSASGLGPYVPDDLLVDDIAAPGDRLVVAVTETAGGVGIARVMVVLTPVA